MIRRCFAGLMLTLWVVAGAALTTRAQEAADQKQEEKESPEKKGVALLEQVVSESDGLKLPENRVHLQIIAADLLWTRNEARARSMFEAAAAGISEMMKTATARGSDSRHDYEMGFPLVMQLRQKLIAAAAQHNATLAYQL